MTTTTVRPDSTGDRADSTRQSRRRSAVRRQNLKWGLIFCSPAIVGLLFLTAYPVLRSLQNSFTSASALTRGRWIGLQNYRDLLTDDTFWTSLGNTAFIMIGAVPLGIAVAFGLALLLNMKVRGRGIYRVFFYLPSIVPLVATAVVWSFVLNPQYGAMNSLLAKFGIAGPGWLSDPLWSKPALIIISVWGAGNLMVILLAGVQDVPEELHEQAKIDGAGVFSRFRNVTLPFLSPHLLFALVTGLIAGFQYFTEVFVLTDGLGTPANSTLVAGLYLYMNAFAFFKIGYASAIAWVLFILCGVSALLVFRIFGRRVYYGGR